MAPFVLVLLAAGTLMIMAHRQNSATERHEKQALEQLARHVESYEDVVRGELRTGDPSRPWTRTVAQRNYGTLVSYVRSDRSLTTLVEFFATYEETSFFGTSTARAYRCYSFRFQEGAEGGPDRTALPLQQCNPI
ncbi:hypothetical protein OG866_13400 [Streptomyces sp. NBC_00663]|uniref:hypothetical protein n=1 Tax=Streptomyces sp. NBC_00663 TaxID=2975801 RepID=UPI002E348170|nr:hypothetical protein [Streptomyces sp. NBC_00663]